MARINYPKGASIRNWRDLIGTIPHGYYSNPEYAVDWFSGHTIMGTADGKQITDLAPADQDAGHQGEGEKATVPFYGASLAKVISDLDKLSMSIRFSTDFKPVTPTYLRLGIFTLLPWSWDVGTLYIRTTNGGTPEVYHLNGHRVLHDAASGPGCSAGMCLGATDGWIEVGDKTRVVRITRTLYPIYTVPMVRFEQVDRSGKWFCRVLHSAWETDDTSQVCDTIDVGGNGVTFTLEERVCPDSSSVRTAAAHPAWATLSDAAVSKKNSAA